MESQERFVGLDVHQKHVMVAAVDRQQGGLMSPRKVSTDSFERWARANLGRSDRVVLEASGNAWHLYDQLKPIVGEVTVANAFQIKLISSSRVKTDKQDAVVLAKLLAANLVPSVWVPPIAVRELRNLVAHRQRLVWERSAAKNRLQSIVQRHNLNVPDPSFYRVEHLGWWAALNISVVDKLRVRHELQQVEQLSQMISEADAEIARLSVSDPWQDQVAFLIQLPGIGLHSAMTILSAIGDIERFPSAEQLVGYAGLGASVHASGQTYHTGKLTKQGRRELRVVLIECAWVAVRHAPYWKAQFEALMHRLGKHKAIVAIARKLLVVIWHVLSKRVLDRNADPQAIARSLMTWATTKRLAASLGLSRSQFVQRELTRLRCQIPDHFRYGTKAYPLSSSA